MKVTWFGTASIALESGGTRLLLDPFFRKNKKLPPIAMDSFCGYDAILLTHGHFDHLMDVPKVMATDTLVPVYCTKTPRKSPDSGSTPSISAKPSRSAISRSRSAAAAISISTWITSPV